MKKYSIVNAYGNNNIGDAAILKVAIDLIRKKHRKITISVHTEDIKTVINLLGHSKNIFSYKMPYGAAIEGSKKINFILKIYRFIKIYSLSFTYVFLDKYFNATLPKKGFYTYIDDIKTSEKIISIGGGYLITKKPLSDLFGLMLTLLPLYIAKLYAKRVIFLPISFGPFGSELQKSIAFGAMRESVIMARDEKSLNNLRKLNTYNTAQIFYAPDIALLLHNPFFTDVKKKKNSDYVVLTGREWLNAQKQEKYEKVLSSTVDYLSKNFQITTIFITMARNPIEDDDNEIADRILKNVNDKSFFKVQNPKSIEDLQSIINDARFAICTRMHSAIFSITVNCPFIALGYGDKSLGLVKKFGLEKWHIDTANVDFLKMKEMINKIQKDDIYQSYIENLKAKRAEIQGYKENILQYL